MFDIYNMCGIAGIISANTSAVNLDHLRKMTETISHRGPDGDGHWINSSGTAGLGHRRLAIIDLTDAAAQPMHYLGRYTITHNGEIYNYTELRDQLLQKGYSFHSQSDTEVILAAYDCWKERCLQYFDGMFSFALWDDTDQCLFAARDRFGEKPFHYSVKKTSFYFSSEMKALWATGIERKLNNSRLLNYLTIGWIENPVNDSETFFENIYTLPPSHYLYFRPGNVNAVIKKYWSLETNQQREMDEAIAIDKFRALFTSSIQKRMRSDVTVGTSLSGGLDSSSIVASILQLPGRSNQLSSFSATSPGFANDESGFIQLLVKDKGILNYQVSPTADDCIDAFEKILFYQEEPFASASIVAQYMVFKLAKQHSVTVLLDGQGADETLAGYHKYYHWFWQELYRAKNSLLQKEIIAAKELGIPADWGLSNKIAAYFPGKTARYLQNRELKRIERNSFVSKEFMQAFKRPETIIKPSVKTLNDILSFNTQSFGLGELLRYADRNSMAHGCEVRLPFLQHELVSFIFSLPAHYKIHDGYGKWLLRKSSAQVLPAEITWRKDKTGFEPPQKTWMENKRMQDYMQEAKKKLVQEKILNGQALYKKIQPVDTHAADNFDWRFMVAAGLL